MSRARQLDSEAQRLEMAADWMLRLRNESASDEEILRWVQWCEADARNQHAFDRVQETWKISGGLAGEVVNGEFVGTTAMPYVRARARFTLALAASCVFALATSALWLARNHGGPRLPGDALVAAGSSELTHLATLADGSRVELAAKSAVAVHYHQESRDLELQAGEAYFAVAPNKRRPFVVQAGTVRARAIGTAFTVRRADDRVVVTVTEGIVDVDRGVAADSIRVAAGNRLSWGSTDNEPVMAAVKPAAALAWREGRLEYHDEPLGAVIADLNRYSSRPVVIRADAARLLRFSGTLLANSTDEWLRALPSTLPVSVTEEDGAYVIASVAGPRSSVLAK